VNTKIISIIVLLLLSVISYADVVKKSSSGICHDQQSPHYDRTKNFKAFDSLDKCLKSGGRLPANFKKSEASSGSSYSRNAFKHWIDENKNCLNTRHELLKSQSTGPVTLDESGCRIIRGRWNDPYTGQIFYDGHKVDVDHLVPLKWAWKNGANTWSNEKRRDFANDERNLFIVSASANRSKGAKDPAEWLPTNEKFHCQYVTRYLRVLTLYKFTDTVRDEIKKIRKNVCEK